ncbi:phasin family protein [Cohaesibacter intestini]|uniref:phasin family protein n=1 Tax=Cohaesibacter intestini TaxID=2211145 RepID=UPI000DE926D3|nr:TIGR01841 family phasin [Cohaesibacter intestini]
MTTAAKKAPVRKKAPAKAAAAATSSKDVKAAAAASPAEEAKTPAAEPKAAAPKARKTAGEAPAVAAGLFAMPSFDMPTSLASHEMTDLAEKSIANARDLYEQAKSSFEDQTSAVEKSFELATESSRDIQGKMVDAARANMDAGFSFLNGLIAAKSISEAIELQTSFAAKQFETLSAQGKDIQDGLTKSMEEATVPMKAAAGKAMESLKIAG